VFLSPSRFACRSFPTPSRDRRFSRRGDSGSGVGPSGEHFSLFLCGLVLHAFPLTRSTRAPSMFAQGFFERVRDDRRPFFDEPLPISSPSDYPRAIPSVSIARYLSPRVVRDIGCAAGSATPFRQDPPLLDLDLFRQSGASS